MLTNMLVMLPIVFRVFRVLGTGSSRSR